MAFYINYTVTAVVLSPPDKPKVVITTTQPWDLHYPYGWQELFKTIDKEEEGVLIFPSDSDLPNLGDTLRVSHDKDDLPRTITIRVNGQDRKLQRKAQGLNDDAILLRCKGQEFDDSYNLIIGI